LVTAMVSFFKLKFSGLVNLRSSCFVLDGFMDTVSISKSSGSEVSLFIKVNVRTDLKLFSGKIASLN
jgi:hypothetical protein